MTAIIKGIKKEILIMKLEMTIEGNGDGYDVDLHTSDVALLYEYIAAICHLTRLLAKDMAEQEGESLEAMEHIVLGIVKDILESNREAPH